jgi:hypothetical protein
MELGEFVLNGAASEIASNDRVVASYLGFQHEGKSGISGAPITAASLRYGASSTPPEFFARPEDVLQ